MRLIAVAAWTSPRACMPGAEAVVLRVQAFAAPMVRLFALLLIWAVSVPPAFAQLLLSPTRVVFEGNSRSSQIDVVNTTNQAATYRLTLVNRRMNQQGEFLPVDTPLPGERFVDAMVRFSPRQLTVEPGGSQVIRLSLRKPQGLASGEYRSHLLIERVLDANLASSIESAVGNTPSEGLDIRLTPLVGALIPVIVREGSTVVEMTVSSMSYTSRSGENPALLSLSLGRTGNRSVYGDLVVTFLAAGAAARSRWLVSTAWRCTFPILTACCALRSSLPRVSTCAMVDCGPRSSSGRKRAEGSLPRVALI